MAKPIRTLELHYPMIQFLIINNTSEMLFNEYMFEPLIDLKISGSPLKLTNNQGI